MGRELKRVPTDFTHPMRETWPGYKRQKLCCNRDPECDECGGDGWISDPIEPPTGDGWQVWETVSEGSPISPVFATSADLVDWIVTQGYSREAAEAFIEHGSVPSMMMCGGRMYRDIESAILFRKKP
jgi:hypothetical protein